MSNRSIENHVEFVLSTYFEREQGQSGAHIRRPYTGAEKDILNKNVMETTYNQRIDNGTRYYLFEHFNNDFKNNYCKATTMRTLSFDVLIFSQIAEFKLGYLNRNVTGKKFRQQELSCGESKMLVKTQFWVYDLKKRDSHICDMQALQPLPAPTNTANTAPAMTTSGGQPPLPVSETV
ncbi:hypothetical protein G5I_14434 [Acromyrmex echinatior]|uniref:Uncharacterized protein n=1 Tax=Acromyrmex echinatior TaxID=103372 RepID=F4X7Q0_ACREC|nr:hypothetical protein G5I_14434 [Acromyrmex echinatior]